MLRIIENSIIVIRRFIYEPVHLGTKYVSTFMLLMRIWVLQANLMLCLQEPKGRWLFVRDICASGTGVFKSLDFGFTFLLFGSRNRRKNRKDEKK